uniref:uncharacterized protein LOC122595330 n=1 Tax=Erigeron canadensis TaxID=72917 RepID=UPI001CB9A766|nr:uncharacterized protein LOC122595330 [Erigeron canadensis]
MSCNYSLHKLCADLSTALQFSAHPSHTLFLKKVTTNWRCDDCFTDHEDGLCYHCSTCNYVIDLRCATIVEQKTIHHPGHPHPLVSDLANTALCRCSACGSEHEGDFYNCTTCFNFSINSDCLSHPIKLLVKSHGSHMLTLSYPSSDQPHGYECRICEREINNEFWLYKCSKCMFYVHLDCATQDRQLLSGNYVPPENSSSDYHAPCNFPLPDEAYNILPSHIPEWKTSRYFDQAKNQNSPLQHFSHKHPLELLISDVKLTSLHNPMNRVKVLCNVCVRPITTTPFYRCSQENECSNFVLHEWCARLRTEVQVDPHIHPHTLVLRQSDSMFFCKICGLPCNGFAYGCDTCRYYVDVNCALAPYYIIHEAHPRHKLLRIVVSSWSPKMLVEKHHACRACRNIIDRGDIFYKCGVPGCDFSLDLLCALRLPKTIRNKCDKHFFKLSYSPIENHRGEYFCEVCEEELNPDKWFYHCSQCVFSVHSACSPLILQSEQDVNSSQEEIVYRFINMKFDGVHQIEDHEHSLSFVAGTKSDGNCSKCSLELQSKIIFKCLQCNFAIHNYCDPSITDHLKEELVEMFENLEEKREPKMKPQPQRVVTFYPKKVARPKTR